MGKKFSDQIRDDADAQFERASREHRRQLFNIRIKLVKDGARYLMMRRYGEAAGKFHTYLRVMEDHKGVGEDMLTPGLFDPEKELAELVMLTGVFWDLAKIYDRAKTQDQSRKSNPNLQKYLDKYLLFSRGTKFEAMCAETMRKYIRGEKPVHREQFRNAYVRMTGNKCFVVSALLEHVENDTIDILRVYRDQSLYPSRVGRMFVRTYYVMGPQLARIIGRLPNSVQKRIAQKIDWIAQRVARL